MTVLHTSRLAAILLVLLTVACSDDPDNPAGPSGNEPSITNVTDNFRFELNGATNFSTNGGYAWQNTGTTATVTQDSAITEGTATLAIRDAGGRIVYMRSLNADGTFPTEPGPAGEWRIDVVPSGVTGSISFRVQRTSIF